MSEPKIELPFIFDIIDKPVRVTLYPTGHLAIGLDEMMKSYGYECTPPILSEEVYKYLSSNWKKELSEEEGKRISDEVECIARAWIVKDERK